MKTLLKIVLGAVIVVVGLVAAGLVWFQAKGSDLMLSKITEAASKAGYEMNIQETSLGLLPPRWIWKNFSLTNKDRSIVLTQNLLSLGTQWNFKGLWSEVPFLQIAIHLEQPNLAMALKEEAPAKKGGPTAGDASAPGFLPPVDVGVALSIENGKVTLSSPGEKPTTIEQFDLAVRLPSVKRVLVHMGAATNNQADFFGQVRMSLPLLGPIHGEFEAGLAKDVVVIPKASVKALGVLGQARGNMNYASGEQAWSLRADAQDFKAISERNLPAQLTGGQLQLVLEAQKNKAGDWKAALEFLAKDLKGSASYRNEDMSSEGNFLVQASLKARYESGKLAVPPFQLNADFSDMGIRYGNLFEKPKGVTGRLALRGARQNDRVQIESLRLQIGETTLQAAGGLSSVPENPQLQLALQVPLTEAKSLKSLVPMLREYPYSGSFLANIQIQGPALSPEKLAVQVNPLKLTNVRGGLNFKTKDGKAQVAGNFSASGELNARTLFKDLKSVQGHITADLSDVDMKWEKLAAKPKGVPFKVSLNGQMGAMPKSEDLLQAVAAQYQMSLGQLNYDGLKFTGISTQGRLKDGSVQGSAKIQSAFGGVVQAKSYSANLVSEPMKIQGDLTTQGVDVQKLTEWLAPEWKESVGGKLQSAVKLQTVFPLPENVSVMKAIAATGQFKITKFYLKSGQINQMIRKKLESISGLGKKVQLKDQTVHATVDGKLSLAKGVMDLPSLRMLTEQNDDIQLSGKMLADLSLQLKGVAHLSDPPIRGVVLTANSDKQGRLVLPLAIEGTITDPSPQILDTTVKKLLENTVKYEVKQQTKKAESKVKDTLEKEAKKLLDGLFK